MGKGKVKPVIAQINTFIRWVTDDIDDGLISPEDGQMLIDMAQDIIDKLS